MPHDELVLQLAEMSLRIERLRAALAGPLAHQLTDAERAELEAALANAIEEQGTLRARIDERGK